MCLCQVTPGDLSSVSLREEIWIYWYIFLLQTQIFISSLSLKYFTKHFSVFLSFVDGSGCWWWWFWGVLVFWDFFFCLIVFSFYQSEPAVDGQACVSNAGRPPELHLKYFSSSQRYLESSESVVKPMLTRGLSDWKIAGQFFPCIGFSIRIQLICFPVQHAISFVYL